MSEGPIDNFHYYLSDINEISLLTVEEEKELGTMVQHALSAADQAREQWREASTFEGKRDARWALYEAKKQFKEARNSLVAANLWLVVHRAKKYTNHGLPLEDLTEEANIVLMRAAEKFDPTKWNTRFSTYATWWIRQGITRALQKQCTLVTMPMSVQKTIYNLKAAIYDQEAELNKKLSYDDVYGYVQQYLADFDLESENYDVDTITQWVIGLRKTVSLNMHIGTEEDRQLYEEDRQLYEFLPGDNVDPASFAEANEDAERLDKDLLKIIDEGIIDEGERGILQKRHGLNGYCKMTLQEVGDTKRLSRERIRQIQKDVEGRIVPALRAEHYNCLTS